MTEYGSVGEVKTGRITANSFRHREVKYSVVGDLAVFEGDIIVGTVAAIEAVSALPDVTTLMPEGVAITDSEFRWPGGKVPYRIDPSLPEQQRVVNAIKHWEAKTPIRFVALDNNNLNQHPDRVLFTPGGNCSASVGRRRGEQLVLLEEDCQLGNVIHEIGHTIGLWHEQSREDRENFIEIVWENIEGSALHNFDQQVTDGDDIGDYDYGSIMHYSATAFSRNGQATIKTKNGAPIGQRSGLSEDDIHTVAKLYPLS